MLYSLHKQGVQMSKSNRPNRKRLTMDMPIVLNDRLKEMAKHYNCTITKYVLRAIVEKLKIEEQYQ